MGRGWRLNGVWYGAVQELQVPGGARGAAWWIVRQGGDGPRHLLQVWEPAPPPRLLDSIREEFLQGFSQGEPLDAGTCHLGFDGKAAWFLQALEGSPFLRAWEEADATERAGLAAFTRAAVARSKVARLVVPGAMGLLRGQVLVPRVLGVPVLGEDDLDSLASLPAGSGGIRLWDQPPRFTEPGRAPIRGRAQELTYLKSLMLGLGSPVAMERVVLLQGEEGLGQDRLCDWAAAAAEAEGIWVQDLEILPGEKPGLFLERLLAGAIAGMEADLYASDPALARALARRLATFAFLRGGRKPGFEDRRLDMEEVDAALGVLAFAQAKASRLFLIRGMEAVDPGLLGLLRGLVGHSRVPWLLAFRGQGSCPGLKSYTESLRNQPSTAVVVLDRLEDVILPEVLGDLLGPRRLPPGFEEAACAASLGNPGLLQGVLESAVHQGILVWREGAWTGPEEGIPELRTPEAQGGGILAGRLERLDAATAAMGRLLALADAPLAQPVLQRILALDADAAEESLAALVKARLAIQADGRYRVASGQARDLILARARAEELPPLARQLVRTLEEESGKPLLSVRLQACARDARTALLAILAALEGEQPGPQEVQAVVEEALALHPEAHQLARLWELLSDAWATGAAGAQAGEGPSPGARALEALQRGLDALGDPGPGTLEEEQAARLLRKRAMLEIRLRRLKEAHQSIRTAAASLADHPFHVEQPRLRLAMGRYHQVQGSMAKAVRALEEGLMLLDRKGPGADRRDQVELLLELGRIQGHQAQFQRALASLEAGKRFLEHEGDRRRLVGVLAFLGQVHQGLGQMDPAAQYLNEALGLARALDDPGLKAACHLDLGILRSLQQAVGPALAHLDRSLRRWQELGDRPRSARAMAWKARTVAVLGDVAQADFLLLAASDLPEDQITPFEAGEREFLGGEIAAFRNACGDARRLFLQAANRFGEAGYLWRERLARLRCIQAEALAPGDQVPESAWIHLERLRSLVDGTGSRWLELEWHRAHALLLSRGDVQESAVAGALLAWGDVVALARELRFPAQVLEAETRVSGLLLARGEKLGARGRIQDAQPSFQELWSRLPDRTEEIFLGRPDIHAFQAAVEAIGLRFLLPAKEDPLADWSPTQANVPSVSKLR